MQVGNKEHLGRSGSVNKLWKWVGIIILEGWESNLGVSQDSLLGLRWLLPSGSAFPVWCLITLSGVCNCYARCTSLDSSFLLVYFISTQGLFFKRRNCIFSANSNVLPFLSHILNVHPVFSKFYKVDTKSKENWTVYSLYAFLIPHLV